MPLTGDKIRLSLLEAQSAARLYGRDCRIVRWALAYRQLRNRLWYPLRRAAARLCGSKPISKSSLNVMIHLRGGLGDCAASRLFVLALREKLPQAVFYIYTDSPQATRAVFEEDGRTVFRQGVAFWKGYDMAWELCQSANLMYANRARIQALAPAFLPVLNEIERRKKAFEFFLSDGYLLEDLLGRWMLSQGLTRLELQSYLSGLDFDVKAAPPLPETLISPERLEHFGLRGKKYITFHDGIDATFTLQGRHPLKCWSKENWQEFARLFKAEFPDILLVQLGGKNSPRYEFADCCLVGKTQVADLPCLLEHSLLHVDGESGLVQLARYLSVRSVVLFGPTDKKYFGIDKNINLKTEKCGSCMWLLGAAWHTHCVLGYAACRNMEALTPQQVFASAAKALEEKLK